MKENTWKIISIIEFIIILFFIILMIIGANEIKKEENTYNKIERLDSKCYYDACVDSAYYEYDMYEGICYCYDNSMIMTHEKIYPNLKINYK